MEDRTNPIGLMLVPFRWRAVVIGCNCGGSSAQGGAKYELTRPDGSKAIFNTMTEARIGLQQAGGGTINVLRSA